MRCATGMVKGATAKCTASVNASSDEFARNKLTSSSGSLVWTASVGTLRFVRMVRTLYAGQSRPRRAINISAQRNAESGSRLTNGMVKPSVCSALSSDHHADAVLNSGFGRAGTRLDTTALGSPSAVLLHIRAGSACISTTGVVSPQTLSTDPILPVIQASDTPCVK